MTTPPQPPPPPGGWPQQPPPYAGWPQQQPSPPPGGWPQRQAPQQAGGWPQQPPQTGWPQQAPPPGAWPPPPPAPVPVSKRIPEDQPFLVRPNLRKRGLFFGGILLLLLVVLGCAWGLATGGDVLPVVISLGVFLLVFGAIFGLHVWLLTSGGPVLAVGPAGLWIKTRPTRGQAIWLPWEAIDHVYRRRWSLEKMVCVKPRDPRTGGNLGAFTALDSGMQQLVFGTGFTATLNFADRSESEIMQAISHYSAGRCRVS